MGLQYARETVRGGVAQYMPGAVTLWQSLRYYFDVNNAFVVKKLGVRRCAPPLARGARARRASHSPPPCPRAARDTHRR